jgi:hypothetical protein
MLFGDTALKFTRRPDEDVAFRRALSPGDIFWISVKSICWGCRVSSVWVEVAVRKIQKREKPLTIRKEIRSKCFWSKCLKEIIV